jgi:hypothetical protein
MLNKRFEMGVVQVKWKIYPLHTKFYFVTMGVEEVWSTVYPKFKEKV